MTPDLRTFDGAIAVVRTQLHSTVKLMLERTGGVDPMALVFATELKGRRLPEPRAIMVALEQPPETFDESTKDTFAFFIKRAVHMTKSVGLVFMYEAWFAPMPEAAPDAGVVEDIPDASTLPDRQEVVVFHVEHGARSGCLIAPIVRSELLVTLGPLEADMGECAVGRFTNFMGRQAEA